MLHATTNMLFNSSAIYTSSLGMPFPSGKELSQPVQGSGPGDAGAACPWQGTGRADLAGNGARVPAFPPAAALQPPATGSVIEYKNGHEPDRLFTS